MSEKGEILKYIMHTPENTNPAIVKSMMEGMNEGSGLPPVSAADNGKLLVADTGEWVVKNTVGGFGYTDDPTPLFSGEVYNEFSTTLTNVPEGFMEGASETFIVTDPNRENAEIEVEVVIEKEGDMCTFNIENPRSENYIEYSILRSGDKSPYTFTLGITTNMVGTFNVSIALAGVAHTIDQKYTFPTPTEPGQMLVSVETMNGLKWKIAAKSTKFGLVGSSIARLTDFDPNLPGVFGSAVSWPGRMETREGALTGYTYTFIDTLTSIGTTSLRVITVNCDLVGEVTSSSEATYTLTQSSN